METMSISQDEEGKWPLDTKRLSRQAKRKSRPVSYMYYESAESLAESIGEPLAPVPEQPGRVSRATEHSKKDGGPLGWLQVSAAFFLTMNSFGLIYSFGVFVTYYQETLLQSETESNLSWIGSIQTFLSLFGGLAVGSLFDRGFLRSTIIAGAIMIVIGMMMTSLAYEYYQFILAQALLVGIGCACLFTPSMAIVPQYFKKNRNLALGMATSGGSIGGIIYPIIFNQLLPKIGFGWSCRVLAFIVLGTMLYAIAVIRWQGKPAPLNKKKGSVMKAWTEPDYILVTLCSFFGFLGIYVPLFYIEEYSGKLGYVDANLVGYLISFINVGSLFGRIIPTYLADVFDTLWVTIGVTAGMSAVGLAWIGVTNQPAVIVFCILFGFFSGAFLALGPSLVAYITTDMSEFGARLGMSLVGGSIGTLIGSPIAGAALVNGWLSLQLFCGTMLAGSWLTAVALKLYLMWAKRQSMEKV